MRTIIKCKENQATVIQCNERIDEKEMYFMNRFDGNICFWNKLPISDITVDSR